MSGNLLDTLLAQFDWWVRAQGVPYTRWVDDCAFCAHLVEYHHNTTHCGRIAGCWMCKDTYKRACSFQRQVMTLLGEPCFTFN